MEREDLARVRGKPEKAVAQHVGRVWWANVTLEEPERVKFLWRNPFVDKLVHRDGEYPFEEIVRAFI